MKIFDKKNSVVKIDEEDLKDAGLSSADFADESVKKRAYVDVLGARLAMKLLFSKKIKANNLYSLYTIHNILGEIDVADIYFNDIKIDVRLVFNNEEIFIPKSHFEYGILPDVYFVLCLKEDLSSADFLGFFEPKDLDKSNVNKDFYFCEQETLQKPENFKKFLDQYTVERTFVSSEQDIEKAQELLLSMVDGEIGSNDKFFMLQQLANNFSLREKLVELENFELMSHVVARNENYFKDGVLDIIGAQSVSVLDDEEIAHAVDHLLESEPEIEPASEFNEGLVGELAEEIKDETIQTENELPDVDLDELVGLEELDELEELDTGLVEISEVPEFEEVSVQEEQEEQEEPKEDHSGNIAGAVLGGIVAGGAIAAGGAVAAQAVAGGIAGGLSSAVPSIELPDVNIGELGGGEEREEKGEKDAQGGQETDLDNFEGLSGEISEDFSGDILGNVGIDLSKLEDIATKKEIENLLSNNVDLTVDYSQEDENFDLDYLVENQSDNKVEESFEGEQEVAQIGEQEGEQFGEKEAQQETELANENIDVEGSELKVFEQSEADALSELPELGDIEDLEKPAKFENDENAEATGEIEEIGAHGLFEADEDDESEEVFDLNNFDFSMLSENDEKGQGQSGLSEVVGNILSQDDVDELKIFDTDAEGSSMQESEPEMSSEEKLSQDYNSIRELTSRVDEFLEDVNISDEDIMPEAVVAENVQEAEIPSAVFSNTSLKDSYSKESQALDEDDSDVLKELFKGERGKAEKEIGEKIGNGLTEGLGKDITGETMEGKSFETKEFLSKLGKNKKTMIAASVAGLVIVSVVAGSIMSGHKTTVGNLPQNANTPPISADGQATPPMPQDGSGQMMPQDGSPDMPQQGANMPAQTEDQQAMAPSRDMGQAVSDAFMSEPVTASISKVAWEVPEDLAYNDSFRKYLQIAGKNLKLTLQSNLLLATEMAYSNKVVVDLEINKDGSLKASNIALSSGSKQIDKIVLQSVKETLQYLKMPSSELSGQSVSATLIINF